MYKRSIAFQLGLYVVTAVVIIISMIVFINYKHSKEIIMEKIEEGAIHQSSLIINEITRNVINSQEVTRNVANQTLYYHSHGDLQMFLHQVVETNPVLTGIHAQLFESSDTLTYSTYWNKDGQLVDKTDIEFCSVFKYPELAELATQEKVGVWSDPFHCPVDSTTLMISYFLPVLDEFGESVGIVAGDINLKFLNRVIDDIQIGVNGFAFVASAQGYYLTHPRSEWVMKRNLFETSSQVFNGDRNRYRQILEDGETGSGFAYPELLNFEKSWFYFAPIPFTNWRVVIVIPTEELFDVLDIIFRKIVLVSVLGFVLILLVVILLFNKMFTPLRKIVRSIQRFSFGERGRRGKRNEIELLSDSLKELQFQYSTYVAEQNQVRKDKRKYEKDLKSAKEIQRTIIPQDYSFLETRREIDLYAVLHPAESIGG
nr:cache domain-containing protein [Sunxiuqinia sp.]